MPEIRIRGGEFHTNVGLSIPVVLDKYHAPFRCTVAVFVDQLQRLPHNHRLLQAEQRAILIYRMRRGPHAKFFARFILTVDGQWHGQRDAKRPTPLLVSKVQDTHWGLTISLNRLRSSHFSSSPHRNQQLAWVAKPPNMRYLLNSLAREAAGF